LNPAVREANLWSQPANVESGDFCNIRLHSAIGSIAPSGKMGGREEVIMGERERKLAAAPEMKELTG